MRFAAVQSVSGGLNRRKPFYYSYYVLPEGEYAFNAGNSQDKEITNFIISRRDIPTVFQTHTGLTLILTGILPLLDITLFYVIHPIEVEK